jgi:hypothetical protein
VLVPGVYIIILGIQGLVLGGVTLVTAFQGEGWGVGILGGLSIVLGLVLLFNVWIGVAALPYILGAFGLVGGVVAIVMAFRMRSAGSVGVRDSVTEGEEASYTQPTTAQNGHSLEAKQAREKGRQWRNKAERDRQNNQGNALVHDHRCRTVGATRRYKNQRRGGPA